MLDSPSSSGSSAGVPQFAAAPAQQTGASTGKAHGPAAIEIFTSFHALVDALAGDSGASAGQHAKAAGGANTAPADEAPAKNGKAAGDDQVIVMPLDIAALLLPQIVAARGAGGSTPRPTSSPDSHLVDFSTTGDLASLLLGGRGLAAGESAGQNVDDTDQIGGTLAALGRQHGLPLGESGANANDATDGASLAQAVIQRLLAAAATGPQKWAAELGPQAGSRQQAVVEDLLRQIVTTSDHSSSALNPAARLVTPHAGELSMSSTTAFAAEMTAASNGLLEPPGAAQVDQIVQTIRMQWSQGGGEAQIRLEPEHFGDLTVSVRVDQGQVTAQLRSDTPAVREWLQTNQQLLRQSLSEHNLNLTRLEVSEPSQSRHGAPRDGQDQSSARDGKPARRPRTPGTGETFEIVA